MLESLHENKKDSATNKHIAYLMSTAKTIMEKAREWSSSIAAEIDRQGSGTIGDWLVLKPVL